MIFGIGRHGIESSFSEWLAAQQPPKSYAAAAQHPILSNGNGRVFRAGRLKAAGSCNAADSMQRG
jgi:hypothetical protein